MDWKAEIEAAVQEGVKAAFERYAPVKEPTDELARRRRRRIELAEDRARRDPVWAEKMARRHAAFADAMATSTSSASASVKPQAVFSGVDIAATTPATCSTQCPSRAITVSVSAIIPSATPTPSTTTGGTTGVIVLERCCFEPEPACAISTTISTPDEMSQANFYDDTPYAGWAAALAVGEHDDDESTSSATTSASNPDESPASSAVCAIDGPPPSAVPRGTTSSGCARTAMHEGENDLICAAPSKCNFVIAQLGSSSTHVSALTDSAVTMLAPNAGTAMVCEDGQHLEATVCTFGLPPSTAPPTETMAIKPGASATNATSLPVACLTLSCEGDTDRTASAVPVAKEDHHLSIDTSESVFILPTLDCSSTNKAKLVPIITKEQDNSPLMSCLLQAHSPRTEPHIQLMYVGPNLDFQSVTHHVRQVLPWDPGQPWCGKGKLSTSEDGLASGVIICLQENSVHELFCCSAEVDAITKYKNVAPRLLSEVEVVLWPSCQSTSRDTILLQPWDPGLLLSVMDNKLQPQPSWGLSVLILSLASQAIYASGNWCYLNCPPRSPDQAIPHWVLVNCDSTSMHFQWAIAVQKWNSRYIWRGNTHFSQLMEWSLQSEFGVFTPGNILLYYYVLVQWEIPRTVILASWKFWLQYCSAGHESLSYHYALSSLQTLSACALLFVQQNYLTICKERWFRFLIGFRIICYNMLSSSNSNYSSSERFVMEHWLMPRNSGDVLVHVLPLTRPHAHVPISPPDDDSFSYVLVLGQECITLQPTKNVLHLHQAKTTFLQVSTDAGFIEYSSLIGCELLNWKIAWPLYLVCSTSGNKSGKLFCPTEVRCQGAASIVPIQFLAYNSMWSFSGLELCQGELSWDPGIWALLRLLRFFTQDVEAPASYRGHYLSHTYYFDIVSDDQDYSFDVFRDQVRIGKDYYIHIFIEQVGALCYLNLVKVCLDYDTHRDLSEVMKHHLMWDPGGSTWHRLEVKPKIKEGGMLATFPSYDVDWAILYLYWAWASEKPQDASATYTRGQLLEYMAWNGTASASFASVFLFLSCSSLFL